MASSTGLDVGEWCEVCGLSEKGIERFTQFGFKIHYCKECDPDAPPKPGPIEINMSRCKVHKALSVDERTGRCGLCTYEKRLEREAS